jgi:hypothetical protein
VLLVLNSSRYENDLRTASLGDRRQRRLCANGSSFLPPRQVSPSDFVRQPVASESTLCRLEGRMTTYSIQDRDSSLLLDERGDRLALIQIAARFSFRFLNLGKTLLPI